MRVILRLVFLLLALCSAQPGFSQSAVAPPVSTPGDGRVAEWMYGEHIPPVRGLPFSAKVELELVNQLQDGTLITHTTYNIDARDSQGRTRNEARNWSISGTGQEPRLTRVELYDPASKIRTNLFPLTKTARQWNITATTPNTTPAAQTLSSKPETSKENIGSDSMQGLPVRGTRVSQTYAAGALGNDRPVTVVTEYWYSEDLKINLLTKRSDPRYGVQTVRVTELVREEPDAALFAISDDYKIFRDNVQLAIATGSGSRDAAPATDLVAASGSPVPAVPHAGVAGVTVPHCIYCPQPPYSEEARKAKINGSVVLRVVVTADGRAENVQVEKAAGHGLDQQAVETVKNWRFTPANGHNGTPVPSQIKIEVTFKTY